MESEHSAIPETRTGHICRSPGEVLRSPAFREIVMDLRDRIGTTVEQFQRLARGDTEGIDLAKAVEDANIILRHFASPNFYYRAAYQLSPGDIPPMNNREDREMFRRNLVRTLECMMWSVSHIIHDTHRRLLGRADMLQSVNSCVQTAPKVSVAEMPAFPLHIPPKYSWLTEVPLVIAAEVRSHVDYETTARKRSEPFHELDHNPLDNKEQVFESKEWIGIPLKVGNLFVLVYIHRTKGFAEMEAGLLNLFPLASLDEIESKAPNAILMFGDPHAEKNDFGFSIDAKNQMLVGVVPLMDSFGYFGYLKKAVLTLHNVDAIEREEFPLHCAADRFEVGFDQDGHPELKDLFIQADDMGKARLEEDPDRVVRLKFYGTETGAFACMDGYDQKTRASLAGSEVGYNGLADSNARQVFPITTYQEVMRGDSIDILLCMDNYTLIENSDPSLTMVNADSANVENTGLKVDEIWEVFRWGKRIAAGSTSTGRGNIEESYFSNPFPLLQVLSPDGNNEIVHPRLYEKFSTTKAAVLRVIKSLVQRGEMHVGIARSQLMAGAGSTLEELAKCGYVPDTILERVFGKGVSVPHILSEDDSTKLIAALNDMGPRELQRWRSEIEKRMEVRGPKRLSGDLIELIKNAAVIKRENIKDAKTGLKPDRVNITIVMVGDSRTGKSETTAAIKEKCGL